MTRGYSDRHWWWILAFCGLYGLLAAFVENSYYQLVMTVVLVWAVMGLAWNLLSGF
jgi:branched-chain amino acid transport system permease protein